jgi:ferric-dicitrate binding protein FerR (iron transport regulator)
MEKNHILTKWLNDELTETELAKFSAEPDFETFEKIKKYSAQLKVADFSEAKILENIFRHKKEAPKVIPLYKNWMFRVAAILIIALGIAFSAQNLSKETQFASNGSRTTFSLPDNSQVVLNSGTEIEYKTWNWNSRRNIELKGEAYFRVAKGKKFEVKTDLGKVTVLGTQFNVKSRKNRFDITCFEGKVKVNYNDAEVILTPGKSVAFENGKQLNLEVENQKPEWLDNKISFNKENLRNILDEIQRQYNTTIEVQTNYSNELFTGKIPLNNLDVALQIIATTYHLEPKKINPNKIIFEVK